VKVKEVNTESPHGIYMYIPAEDAWMLVAQDGDAFKPSKDGIYITYFDNAKCPACRKYDKIWFPFVREACKKYNDANFIIVLCDWFARECKSSAASKTFQENDIHASPTTVFFMVKDGKKVYEEKYEGVLYEFELKLILEGFKDRAEKSMRGEKVTLPISKESSSKALEKLILQIISEILAKEGKKEKK